jgi:hypothetical protein
MNAAGASTPGGGTRWWPSHVHRLMGTQDARELLNRLELQQPLSSAITVGDEPIKPQGRTRDS